jgi:hypothetical protein
MVLFEHRDDAVRKVAPAAIRFRPGLHYASNERFYEFELC